MSSWWAAVHGYNHPKLNAAVTRQLGKMAHVMFGGLTHPPAVRLAERLIEITPEPLTKVFFADSGSVAVEVAIKMALQYWRSRGRPERHRLLTVRGGYHGDTFGDMAVCDPVNGMHHLFGDVLAQHVFAPPPPLGYLAEPDQAYLDELSRLAADHAHELAGIIVEPIVQGAGGMRFYAPDTCAPSATSPTSTACCSSSTRSPPVSAGRASCGAATTPRSPRTSCASARRSPAAT